MVAFRPLSSLGNKTVYKVLQNRGPGKQRPRKQRAREAETREGLSGLISSHSSALGRTQSYIAERTASPQREAEELGKGSLRKG